MRRAGIVLAALALVQPGWAADTLRVSPGFVYKVRCEGRLLVSAVGNEAILRLEALPKESGCGVMIKPVGPAGVTNLILETSSGPIAMLVEIRPGGTAPRAQDLEIALRSREAR